MKRRTQTFDFYSENAQDFYGKFTVESVLVQGSHWKTPPQVSIVLTTYNRPNLLMQALESALNQNDFEDYQIIIADNEGASIEEQTATSRLIAKYSSPKIIYYRHRQTVDFNIDYAARIAKSPWICFLHDDDILASNYMINMYSIVKKYKKIKFLSCTTNYFISEKLEKEINIHTKTCMMEYQIMKYPKNYMCLGYFPGWLGAFIDRNAYISVGGIPTIKNGIGDYCMVGKFNYCHNVYELSSNTTLYFYRVWSGQASSGGTEVWTRAYRAEYSYHTYVTQIYHKFFCSYWNRISAYRILSKCDRTNKGSYHTNIDLEQFVKDCNMPADILEKSERYRRDMMFRELYEIFVEKFCSPIKYEGNV